MANNESSSLNTLQRSERANSNQKTKILKKKTAHK